MWRVGEWVGMGAGVSLYNALHNYILFEQPFPKFLKELRFQAFLFTIYMCVLIVRGWPTPSLPTHAQLKHAHKR